MNIVSCRTCHQPIIFARRGDNTDDRFRWVALEPHPTPYHQIVDAHDFRVLDGHAAYTSAHMRERLMLADADRGPAEDFPWHRVHTCENGETA